MIPVARSARLGVVAGALGLLAVPMVGQAHAWSRPATSTPTVSEDRLTVSATTPDKPVTATLTTHSTSCFTVKRLGVAVRDATGANLDFPGSRTDVQLCPAGITLTTAARSFPAGAYSVFGYYQDQAGAWHNLAAQKLTVAAAPVTPAAPAAPASPVAGQKLTWADEFSGGGVDASRWADTSTSSYHYRTHNPNDNKLDWLDPADVKIANGSATFTARPGSQTLENGAQAWNAGLLTTEGSTGGFQVKTGDYAETRVQLPTGTGAWPALWTWNPAVSGSHNEIDSFEYHPDNPNLLELTNHVNAAQDYLTDANAIKPGQWVTIGTHYGANSVDWYVNGAKVFSDHTGVGANWSAYLILNLSVSAGKYHPAPTGSAPISFAADYVRVFR
ncbi:hypothetical protein ACFYNO_21475 [Kitasatospora sp. NPDC006697]|uniref:glycoside hydrolase family 16 protein n=1 Tax=Kitasatospora sp. NPDC006697 TaxID=3364020 RepID=UPI0036B07BFE